MEATDAPPEKVGFGLREIDSVPGADDGFGFAQVWSRKEALNILDTQPDHSADTDQSDQKSHDQVNATV